MLLLSQAGYCFAQGTSSPAEGEPAHVIDMAGMSEWLRARFSQTELEALHPGELKVEPYYCGCFDSPRKHFPYSVVLLKTPRGDLIARPERGDESVRFTALAVKFGDRYCDVESEQSCLGTFAHPCDFTDFRYGPSLVEFFPTCKSDEAEIAAVIAFDFKRFGP